jgi:hypothetical protein
MRRRGEEYPEAKPVHGHGQHPLDLAQVDHTPIDLIVVDPIDREPIGRLRMLAYEYTKRLHFRRNEIGEGAHTR